MGRSTEMSSELRPTSVLSTASTVDRSTGGSPTRRAHQRIVSLGYADDGAEGKSEADSPAGSPGIYTDDGEGDEDAWSYVL